MAKRRVGIVGAGALGQYLIEAIANDPKSSAAFEIAFVWNRSFDKVARNPLIPEEAR
jgi:predicted dinucleotide-utilizing enzyme